MFIKEKLYKKIMEKVPVVCTDALILNEKKEFLLIKRKNEPLKNIYWMIGGRLHKNELIENGIKRKLHQEIGVKNIKVKYLGFFEEFFLKTKQNVNNGFHSISFVYLAFINSNTKIKIDEQSSEFKWFKKLPLIFYKTIPWLKKNF
jgi:colanic acid biosynthesis protein WcaH